MPKPSSKAILSQLAKRDNTPFKLEDFLFKEQLVFVNDPSKYKIAITSRRSGKTVSCAADLINIALLYPETTSLYVTLSRTMAKRNVWSEIKKINKKWKLGFHFNESELMAEAGNGSIIYCSGASDRTEIEKFRGLALKKVYIDETQSFPAYIKDLIDDVIAPALMDYNGSLSLIGTPGPIPSGYFYECSRNSGWSSHFWTFFDNPYIAKKSGLTHQQTLNEVLKTRGVDASHPSIQREYYGRWVLDTDALVFHYKQGTNHYEKLAARAYTYILGVDLGFDDADALAVLAWSDEEKRTYLVEECISRKQGITELVEQIERLRARYSINKIVIDQGGLGKKIAEEIIRRYKVPVVAAEKQRKQEFIELMNDALRTGQLMASRDSQFAADCQKVEWDLDKSTPDKKVISKRFHSDICDAVLYAWRESYSFTYEKPVEKPIQGSRAWTDELEEQALEHFTQIEANEKKWGPV